MRYEVSFKHAGHHMRVEYFGDSFPSGSERYYYGIHNTERGVAYRISHHGFWLLDIPTLCERITRSLDVAWKEVESIKTREELEKYMFNLCEACLADQCRLSVASALARAWEETQK